MADETLHTDDPEQITAPLDNPQWPDQYTQEELQEIFNYWMDELNDNIIGNTNIPEHIRGHAETTRTLFLKEISSVTNPENYGPDVWNAVALVPLAVVDIVMTHQQNYRTAAREPEGVHVMQYSPDHGLEPGSAAETQRTYTVDMQRIVWKFLREHPELPVCGQILLDWVHTIQASDQSTHSLYKDYEALKKQFYKLYVNMNKDVPTTDSQVDIARTASIIRAMHAEGKSMRKVGVAGSGNMSRFEGPLFRMLRQEGYALETIVAVDLEEHGAEIAQAFPELNVEFHKGNVLDVQAFGGKKVDVLLYPWSVFSDILPGIDSIRALHTAASLLEVGGTMVIDQAVPTGPSSYRDEQAKQAAHTGVLGVIERSFAGPDGQKLWSTFNIMELESFLRDAAQAGFVPRNIGPTVAEQHAVVSAIEADESMLVRQANSRENLDAMKYPIYQANGWNRMTLALEYVGQEEALRRAKAAPSLFHTLSLAVGEAKNGT